MKALIKLVLVAVALCALVSCGHRVRPYSGPPVTAIEEPEDRLSTVTLPMKPVDKK